MKLNKIISGVTMLAGATHAHASAQQNTREKRMQNFLVSKCPNPILKTQDIPIGNHQLCNNGTLALNIGDLYYNSSSKKWTSDNRADEGECNRFINRHIMATGSLGQITQTTISAEFINLDASNDETLQVVWFGKAKDNGIPQEYMATEATPPSYQQEINDPRHIHCNGLITGAGVFSISSTNTFQQTILVPDFSEYVFKDQESQEEIGRYGDKIFSISVNDEIYVENLPEAAILTDVKREMPFFYDENRPLKDFQKLDIPNNDGLSVLLNQKSDSSDAPDFSIGEQIKPLKLDSKQNEHSQSGSSNKNTASKAFFSIFGLGLVGAGASIYLNQKSSEQSNNAQDRNTGLELPTLY